MYLYSLQIKGDSQQKKNKETSEPYISNADPGKNLSICWIQRENMNCFKQEETCILRYLCI
jgi:hypothetical protein